MLLGLFYVNTVLDVKPSQLGISDTLNARSLCESGVWQIPVHYALLRFTAFFLCFTSPISLVRQKRMVLQPVDRHFAEKRRSESVTDFSIGWLHIYAILDRMGTKNEGGGPF